MTIDTQELLDKIVEKTLQTITDNKKEHDVAISALNGAKAALKTAKSSLENYVIISRMVEDKDTLPLGEKEVAFLLGSLDKVFLDFVENN